MSARPGPTDYTAGARFAVHMRRYRIIAFAICVLFVCVVGYFALHTRFGQALDTFVMYAFQSHMPFPSVGAAIMGRLVSVPTLLVLSFIVLATTLFRRRYALLLRFALVLVIANAVTQVLKLVVLRPDLGVGHVLSNSFPSGHVTLAVSVGLVLLDAVPSRWRTPAGVAVWLSISAVSVAVLTMGWHRLSDVVAGIVIPTAVAVILLPAEWDPFRPPSRGLSISAFAWLSLIVSVALLAGEAVVWRGSLRAPVSAMELADAATTSNPGAVVTLAAVVIVMAMAGLSIRAVDRLTGN